MPYSWHLSAQKTTAIVAMIKRFDFGAMELHILLAYSNLIAIIVLFGGMFFYAPAVSEESILVMLVFSLVTYTLLKNGLTNRAY